MLAQPPPPIWWGCRKSRPRLTLSDVSILLLSGWICFADGLLFGTVGTEADGRQNRRVPDSFNPCEYASAPALLCAGKKATTARRLVPPESLQKSKQSSVLLVERGERRISSTDTPSADD